MNKKIKILLLLLGSLTLTGFLLDTPISEVSASTYCNGSGCDAYRNYYCGWNPWMGNICLYNMSWYCDQCSWGQNPTSCSECQRLSGENEICTAYSWGCSISGSGFGGPTTKDCNCNIDTECSCTSWDGAGCGTDPCKNDERKYTRTCDPLYCKSQWKCEFDSRCNPDPTPTPIPCTVTAPTNPSAVSDATSAVLGWNPGDGGVQQLIRIGTDQTEVNSGCPGGAGPGLGCVVAESMPLSQSGYQTGDILSPETTYYWRVIEYETSTCWVDFGGVIRTASSVLFTTPELVYDPWWHVVDGDVITNGNIISMIPSSCALPGCNPLFGLEGLGGFPGVPIYGGSSAEFGEGEVSSTGWSANTESLFGKIYDYDFFSRLVRSDVTLTEIDSPSVNGGFFTSGGAPSRGFVWYHFDGNVLGDLTINSSVNMPGDRKVVVLVEDADLYINDRINVVDGTGFMMFIVGKADSGTKGNIYVHEDVSHPVEKEIEGVFLAEGQFRTGEGDNQLHIRGMVAAYGGIVLERDLEGDNADEPAEVFEFAPDFILNFPRDLTFKRLRWKEVAP